MKMGRNPATSFLGTIPGGAGAMAAMSDSLHADTRFVTAISVVSNLRGNDSL
jgi:uncharacterized membrane protein AbrB (regulator of aidB expression)